jgi:predicted nucleic acid-binding protein
VILVDSSVWINHLRGIITPSVRTLRGLGLQRTRTLMVGDLILMEVLMGARSPEQAARLYQDLTRFPIVSLVGVDTAQAAARNYRYLRSLGVTLRTGFDLLIATFCIERGHRLLHDDRDFGPMVEHLGLKIA